MKEKHILDNSKHCGLYIKQIHDMTRKLANNYLREKGITIAQLRLLTLLRDSEQETYSLKELEKLFKVSQAAMAGVVSRLEDKGYVEAVPVKEDKRVKHIKITKSGIEICHGSDEEIEQSEVAMTGSLTSEELESFVSILKKICASIE